MSEFLTHVALIEAQQRPGEECSYRIRIAGMQVEQVFGPIGGKDIASILTPEIEARWRSYFGAVRDAARPLRLSGRIAFENKNWLNGEALIAPLGEANKPVQMIFAAFASWPEKLASDGLPG